MRPMLFPEASRDRCKQKDKPGEQSVVRVRGSTGNIGGGSVGRTGEDEHRRHTTQTLTAWQVRMDGHDGALGPYNLGSGQPVAPQWPCSC